MNSNYYDKYHIMVTTRKTIDKKIRSKKNYEVFLFVKYIKGSGYHGIVEKNINEKDKKIWHQYYCKCVEKYGRLIDINLNL